MNKTEIQWALSYIQVFLATNECHEYLDDIKTDDRTLTLNTLLQLEKNIINKENGNNEEI